MSNDVFPNTWQTHLFHIAGGLIFHCPVDLPSTAFRTRMLDIESYCDENSARKTGKCESEIERIFLSLVAMMPGSDSCWGKWDLKNPYERVCLGVSASIPENGPAIRICPQYQLQNGWRLDFGILLFIDQKEVFRIAVECDGHDWHERTKQQAARDRSRDRYLQDQGWRVYRFTGSEIFYHASDHVMEVFAALETVIRQHQGTAAT